MGCCGSQEAPPKPPAKPAAKTEAPPKEPEAPKPEPPKPEPPKEEPKPEPPKEEPKPAPPAPEEKERWIAEAHDKCGAVTKPEGGETAGYPLKKALGITVVVNEPKSVNGETMLRMTKPFEGWINEKFVTDKEPVIQETDIVPEKAKAKLASVMDEGAENAGKEDADEQFWKAISKIWKDEDGDFFSKQSLASHFPAGKTKEDKDAREKIWRELDNGNNIVSLAEYDNWFNDYTKKTVREKDPDHKSLGGDKKSDIYVYAKKGLIRAFNLANGVAPGDITVGGKKLDGDDWITKKELRILMLATQAVLMCTRFFDMMDDTGDRRVGQKEWNANLPSVNEELRELVGPQWKDITEEDFLRADQDGGGGILLDEAVFFLLPMIFNDPILLEELKEEGC